MATIPLPSRNKERKLTMNEMLGKLVVQLVTFSDDVLRILCDLVEKLSSRNGREWTTQLKRFLRKEPCWVEKVKEAKVYLRHLFTFKLGAVDGKDTYATARKVFRGRFTPDLDVWGIVFSGRAPETEVVALELVRDGRFTQFLGNTAEELEKLRLLGSQFLAICEQYHVSFRDKGYANFFVLTKGDKPVVEDLSNVLVAYVGVKEEDLLGYCLYHISHDLIWGSAYKHRVFCPQQAL